MSQKFVVEGGLKLSSGTNFELSGYDVSSISNDTSLTNGSSAALITENAVKSYVDSQLGASALTFATDDDAGGFNLDIDLDSESLSIVGTANEIETVSSADNTIKIGLPDSVTIGDALTVTGLATMNGSVDLGDANTDTVTFNARVDSNLEPSADSSNDLGSSSLRWANLHVDSIAGGADEMIISADGDENSASGGISNSLTLNASAGIYTGDAVDMDSTLDVAGATSLAASGLATDIRGTLSVDEAATFDAGVTITGAVDINNNMDVSGTVDLAASGTLTDIRGTLSVDETATFDMQSVHTGGIQTGGDIISDTDSTDSLGSALVRWADVHTDKMTMEHSARKDFSVSPTGSATTAFTFENDAYKSGKIVASIEDASGNITACEVLVASDGSGNASIVQYGTVSTGDEVSMAWTIAESGTTTTVSCNATGTLKGHYDLQAV